MPPESLQRLPASLAPALCHRLCPLPPPVPSATPYTPPAASGTRPAADPHHLRWPPSRRPRGRAGSCRSCRPPPSRRRGPRSSCRLPARSCGPIHLLGEVGRVACRLGRRCQREVLLDRPAYILAKELDPFAVGAVERPSGADAGLGYQRAVALGRHLPQVARPHPEIVVTVVDAQDEHAPAEQGPDALGYGTDLFHRCPPPRCNSAGSYPRAGGPAADCSPPEWNALVILFVITHKR